MCVLRTQHFALVHTIRKVLESGDLCGNITEFLVVEGSDHLSPQGTATPNKVI